MCLGNSRSIVLAFILLFTLCRDGLTQKTSPKDTTVVMQSLYNPYWTSGSGFQSLAQLHNNLITGALTVTPVLYGPDGTSLALDPLTLPPLGNVTLDIGNEAATKGWSKYQTGSVVFQYQQNHSGALGAEVYVENRAQSLSFTIPSVESAPRSATQNAVFWLPSPEGEVYVALQNTSDKAVVLTATATLGGRTISLGDVTLVGHASSVIPLSKRSGFAAGAWVNERSGRYHHKCRWQWGCCKYRRVD